MGRDWRHWHAADNDSGKRIKKLKREKELKKELRRKDRLYEEEEEWQEV